MASQMKLKSRSVNREQGVALLFCLVALLILTAITTSLVLMSGTDTTVNANYRSEETAFFAAKAGVYEALDRMQQSNANSIAASLPTTTSTVLYLINSGSSLTVQPWTTTNTYNDDEFCHEGLTIGGWPTTAQVLPPDVPCNSLPTGSTWYTSATSNYPWAGTSAAIPYEWVRINWKVNSSESYVSGTGTSAASTAYSVNSSKTASTPVCWNGGSEVLLSTPAGVSPAYTSCEQYQTCGASNPVVMTPVFTITALSVTSNGSRQMVQMEAALNPPSISVSPCGISDPYGFFAYGNGCASPPFLLAGNASVDGFNSANGPYNSSTNHSNTTGSIGSNGAVSLGGSSTSVGGKVYVPNIGSPPGPGSCPVDFSVSGNPTYGGLVASTVLNPPTVSIPANSSTTDLNVSGNQTIAPGTYRNVNVSGNGVQLTLTAPGTYNFNSLTVATHAILTISPANKAVTINIAGNGTTTPISMGSHATIVNTSGVSDNIQINYAGTGSLSMQGGPSAYAVVNAPNASVVMGGGSDWYGTIMANSIDDHGGISLHFDTADTTLSGATAATATANATGSYNTLAFRSVPY